MQLVAPNGRKNPDEKSTSGFSRRGARADIANLELEIFSRKSRAQIRDVVRTSTFPDLYPDVDM